MPIEKQDIQQMVAAASGYKFEDVERQKQYERLLADLNLIVEKNTFDQIWDDVGLLAEFQQKLEVIMDLVEAERIETVWDRERCVEWVEEAGIEDAESYVDNNFKIFDDHIEIKGDLDLEGSQVQVLPFGLTKIGGFLDLKNSQVRELPAGLTSIGGFLDLRNSQVRELPAGLMSIGGGLDLGNSQVRELPAGLTSIGSFLDLRNSQVRELPAGLMSIGGFLYLGNSQVQELPAGLTTIGGNLYLKDSQIKDIPDNLVIQLDVWAKGCPQSLIDKLNKMKEKGNIKGRVITT